MLSFLILAACVSVGDFLLSNKTFIPFITGPMIEIPFGKKCFDDLGCFYNGPPWFSFPHRPLSFLPVDDIQTLFLLFTPTNVDEPRKLHLTDDSITNSNINPNYQTKIIVHGYNVNVELNDTRYRIKQALLRRGSFNVILVDWSYNNQPPYPQAVANARVVGAHVAKLVNILQRTKNINLDDVHIIGHSLGAHVSGFAGKRLDGVGRITGLDPAGPYFQQAHPMLRLDRSDAKFVDVIHTNAANNFIQGFGLEQTIGHIDFYPNGGNHQPGCATNLEIEETVLEGFLHLIASSCDHSRAYEYFISSIAECDYRSVQCTEYWMYKNNMCTDDNSQTSPMGYSAQKITNQNEPTKFYLRTTSTSPFCEKNEIPTTPNVINNIADLFFGP